MTCFHNQLVRIAAAVLAFGVFGCETETTLKSKIDHVPKNKVVRSEVTHMVNFAASNSSLSTAEAERLDQFLARHGIRRYDREEVYRAIALTGDSKSKATASRDLVRQKSVVAFLRRRGQQAQVANPRAALGAVPNGTVFIVLDRYAVITPQCPDWSGPTNHNYSNLPMSNLGCANETNLGVMVANPADLVRGQPLTGAPDSDRMTNAIETYRKREEEPLVKEEESQSVNFTVNAK